MKAKPKSGTNPHLEYIAKIASAFGQNELLMRFYLQAIARDLLPRERVAECMRVIAPFKSNVEIRKATDSKRAHYRNLVICSRLWQCPVCAATITEERRRELTEALSRSQYFPVLLTYTLRHKKADKLTDLLSALLSAFRAYKSGRAWQSFTEEYSWVGSVRSLEVTYAQNGWHPHIHELALLEIPITPGIENGISLFIKKRWQAVIRKQDYDATWERGADVRTEDHEIREYVAKFGRLPEATNWTIEHELVKSPSKRGKIGGSTPMQLLIDYGEGDTAAGRLFIEYSAAFKGRNQLVWSRGLRALLGITDELTDEQIAENAAQSGEILATITRQQWREILKAKCRAELLVIAANVPQEALLEYIADIIDTTEAKAGV